MRQKSYFVYLMASKRNGTLYLGVTNNLVNRTWQHKSGAVEGFTKKYGVHMLVWYDEFYDIREAIECEKRIKGWNRAWKIKLIEKQNPEWRDLTQGLAR